MAKNSIDAYGAAGKTNLLLMDPDKLTIVEDDTGSALYDPDRANLPVDEALVLNIMTFGVIEPVVIWKDPETGIVYVVDGRQRVKACREANQRLKKQGCTPLQISCVVRRGDGKHMMGVMISSFIRQDDTPLGRARKLARYLDLGHSEEQASVTFGISVSSVKNLLTLNDAPRAIQKAVETRRVTATDGVKLAKMDPEAAKAKLAELPPAAPRGERRPRAAARKAKEVLGGKTGALGKRELVALLKEVQESNMKEMWRAGAEAALMAALGDDKPLRGLF